MWSQLAAAVFTLLTFTKGEIFDVTTIYDLSSVDDTYRGEVTGRIHARTNGLGLQLFNQEGEPFITEDAHLNLTCDLNDRGCSWNHGTDWEIKIKGATKEIKRNKKYKVNKWPVSIGFEVLSSYTYSDDVFIYFSNILPSPRFENVLVRFHKDRYSRSYVYIYKDCIDSSISRNYHFSLNIDGEISSLSCYQSYNNYHFDFDSNIFSFNVSDGSLQLYSLPTFTTIAAFTIGQSELEFQVYYRPTSNKITPVFSFSALSPTVENGSEIISPLVMVEDVDKVCLTLVISCKEDYMQDVLHLFAQDLRQIRHFLQAVNNVEKGINVKQVCFNIDNNILRPFKLILRNLVGVSIVRISSFNLEGEEVKQVEPIIFTDSTYSKFVALKSIYHAGISGFVEEPTINRSLINTCKNGGIMTDKGCACPPGYSGLDCQTACGPNKFGHDCGGLCSLRSKMCQDLLLCTPITGCHCAPGFEGEHCNKNCTAGAYGNDCEQVCGHCSSNLPCDASTGKCQACEPGYVPPYCKEAYVYYASKPELSSTDYGTITVKFNLNYVQGVGIPELYQIQYREKTDFDWSIYINKNIEEREDNFDELNFHHELMYSPIEENIDGLKAGHLYHVRILLMDENFNKYDDSLVQSSEIVTKCDIPVTYDYKIKTKTSASSIMVSWSYTNETEHWCPTEEYEVSWKENWKWKTIRTAEESFTLNDLLPNKSIRFKVRAKTSNGYAPFSRITVSTQHKGSSEVTNLRVVTSHSTSSQISWNPPKDEDRHLIYRITYKCIVQPACSPGCVNATEGALTQDQTSVTLSPLLPFTQYLVTVAPEDGPETSINVGTKKIAPTEVPKLSAQAPLRTNTSLTVFWDPVPVCSGFLQGYKYHLIKEFDNNKILDSGFTKNTNTTFHNLTASTEYHVRVFVVTIAGWNPEAFLDIKSSTSATVPEAVQNLTVYKRGRNILGLRWAAPRASYGTLKAFTIIYSLGTEEMSQIVEPTPCVPWSQFYCHTLQGLRANRKYNVSVSARNSEVAEDGVKTSVSAVTKESPPTAPEGLKLTNSSSTSMSIEWRYPSLANGVIRSFLISVEETEQFNQDDCCQIYPLIENPVQEEQLCYTSEVSGLHPASTYFVSVSAKTVGLGPSQSLVIHTKPPHLPFSLLPRLQSHSKASWLPQDQLPQLNKTEVYASLIKAHLLLAVVDQTGSNQVNNSGVYNPQLNLLLQQLIKKPFFFYMEYDQDNLDVTLTTTTDVDSDWGAYPTPSPIKTKDTFKIVVVQVSEYANEYNVDLRYLSEAVTFDV